MTATTPPAEDQPGSVCGSVCGGYDRLVRTSAHCPTCGRVRPMSGFIAEWYGLTLTCIGCGDMWTDGEMHPRPFQRAWRQKSIARALVRWRQAEPLRTTARAA